MLLIVILFVVLLFVTLALMPGSTPRIDARRHPNGIAVLERVPVNDTQQWVLIRSEDVANPIVLFVHGGPGMTELALVRKHTRALERRFIVVNWDQRGAGKSFAAGRDAAHMNIGQFVEDVIAVSSYLANRFREARIVLVGHSWGSAIGLRAVAKRPDLFSAYIGIGQLARAAEGELISYRWTLEQAQRAGATATVQALTKIGPPPYAGPDWRSKLLAQRRALAKYGGEYRGSATGAFGVLVKHVMASREYTFADRINFFRGLTRSLDLLFPALDDLDFFAEIPTVAVPIYFCLGRHDYEVPSGVAARYFEMLNAPSKRLIWFEQSAHMPNIEEQDAFNRFMAETLRPVL